MIDVTDKERQIVNDILQKHVPGCEIRVFGSRLTENHRRYSDLDIAIVSSNKLGMALLGGIKYDFEECDLPYRVDVLDWHSVSKEFQEVINRRYEVLAAPVLNNV